MIKWIANRIHAAWLNACYDWITLERADGSWSVVSTEDPEFRKNFVNEDQAEAWIDRRCAYAAAVHVLCFWRRKP